MFGFQYVTFILHVLTLCYVVIYFQHSQEYLTSKLSSLEGGIQKANTVSIGLQLYRPYVTYFTSHTLRHILYVTYFTSHTLRHIFYVNTRLMCIVQYSLIHCIVWCNVEKWRRFYRKWVVHLVTCRYAFVCSSTHVAKLVFDKLHNTLESFCWC